VHYVRKFSWNLVFFTIDSGDLKSWVLLFILSVC